jgi:hypothetical protein
MTAPNSIPQPEAVSRLHACRILRMGERQLRRLIRAGRLQVVRSRYSVRITLVSILAFISSRAEKAGISGHLPEPAALCPTICARHLDTKSDEPHNTFVERVIETTDHMATELLPLSRGAAAVGMSEKVFGRLVRDGVIPSVEVGSRRRVNADVLRTWSRGSGKGETA